MFNLFPPVVFFRGYHIMVLCLITILERSSFSPDASMIHVSGYIHYSASSTVLRIFSHNITLVS